jgi:hypothetical protein
LLEAASICRSLTLSDSDGAGALLLFALYFEDLVGLREADAIDADRYASLIDEILVPVNACLDAIEAADAPKLLANLDSFARTTVRYALP